MGRKGSKQVNDAFSLVIATANVSNDLSASLTLKRTSILKRIAMDFASTLTRLPVGASGSPAS